VSALYFCDLCGQEMTGKRSTFVRVEWNAIYPNDKRFYYESDTEIRNFYREASICEGCSVTTTDLLNLLFPSAPAVPRRS
jgi:hypothetical protein